MKIWALAKKELRSYFNSPLAYIFIGVFLVLSSVLFFQYYFVFGVASMRQFFSLVPWLLLLLVPAISMRLWSEEKKLGTYEILLTLPVTDTQLVLGKFLAGSLLIALCLLLSTSTAFIVYLTGPADIGAILTSYMGALLIGMSYLALGIWISALTDNQIVAFISTVAACFLVLIAGTEMVTEFLYFDVLKNSSAFLSLYQHYESIGKGVLDSRDLIYFASFIGFFIYLNTLYISLRRL